MSEPILPNSPPSGNTGAERPAGFRRPTTTPVPDEIFDKYLADLSGGALKVLLYIVRRTLGFKKNRDAISFNQFLKGVRTRDGRVLDKGCGLKSTSTINAALQELYDKGLINRRRSMDERGENEITVYSLRFEGEDEDDSYEDPRSPYNNDPRGVLRKSKYGTSEIFAGGTAENEVPVLRKSKPQQTVKQETEHKQQHMLVESSTGSQDDVVVALSNLGVTKGTAQALARKHPEAIIRAQIDMLEYRKPEDPAAVLVKAIREDWAPPAGYETPEQREARADREEHVEAARDEALQRGREYRESWPRRMIEQYEIDRATLDLWERVQGHLPGLIGAGAYNRSLADALLAPPGATYATVLVPTYSHKLQLRLEHHRALEQVLHCELGREVRVEIRYAP